MKGIPRWFTGEFVGAFLVVFFGCGSVCTAVLAGAQVGGFQVAIVWGLGIATAIYLTGSLSGAHLNPAVTVSRQCARIFPFVIDRWIACPKGNRGLKRGFRVVSERLESDEL